jgi:hypothetical protein
MDSGHKAAHARRSLLLHYVLRLTMLSTPGKVLLSIFLFVFGIIPIVLGYVLSYAIVVNIHERMNPAPRPTFALVQYANVKDIPPDLLDANLQGQMNRIRDSLTDRIPIAGGTLKPFELRPWIDPDTQETVFLFHARLSCGCQNQPGQFRLIVFQLDTRARSYTLCADTLMAWDDYVRPFNLQRPIQGR